MQYLVKINQHERARVILGGQIEGQLLNPTAKLSLGESQTGNHRNPVKKLLGWISLEFDLFMGLLFYQFIGLLSINQLDANHSKNSRIKCQQFSLITAIFPFGGVVGAIIAGLGIWIKSTQRKW